MSFPTYKHLKDSGFQWLGKVPDSWEVNVSRRYFYEIREAGKFDDVQLSATQKFGVVPQTMFMELEDQKVVLALKGLSNFKHVEPDDFVISLRSFQGGIERSKYRGCVSPAYTVLRPKKIIDPAFIAYVFKSAGYIVALQSVTDGIREGKNIKYDQFAELGLALPPVTEQKIIAKFLDHETAKIDSLVAEQEKLIELLKEKRQAVISHAVTKGLDAKATMKETGLEWLGEVPEHWSLSPLKKLLSIQNGSDYKNIEQADGYPVYGSGGVFTFASKYLHDGESVLLGRKGTVDKPLYVNGKFWTVDTMYWSKILNDFSAKFCYYITKTIPFEYYSTKTALPSMTKNKLNDHLIAHPNRVEQDEIVDFLDKKLEELDKLIHTAQEIINLFLERRSALISAAVTGQIDVRNYQPKEVA